MNNVEALLFQEMAESTHTSVIVEDFSFLDTFEDLGGLKPVKIIKED